MEQVSAIEAVKRFFGTPDKPLVNEELMKLGASGVKDLAPECAKALNLELKPWGQKSQ